MTDHRSEMRLKLLVVPELFHRSLSARLMQFQDAAPVVVRGRDEEEIPWSPDRGADRDPVIRRVGMPPQQLAVIRVKADRLGGHQSSYLRLPVHIDQDGG